jgi:hypothetical protein
MSLSTPEYISDFICTVDVWRSEDGINWQCLVPYANWSSRWQHAACVHNGYIYLMGGWGDDFLNDGTLHLLLYRFFTINYILM